MRGSGPGSGGKLSHTWIPVLISLVGVLALSAPAEAKRIAAYPSPGTQLASPQSNISFNGVTRATLGRIVVRGSRTGSHRGRLVNFAGPVGVAFLPAQPFAPRERVTVTARAHTFFGTGGRRSFAFRTGEFLPERAGKSPVSPAKGQKPRAWESYRTLRLRIPKPTIHQDRPGKAAGKIFYAPRTSGPTIRDEAGELIWYRPGLRVTDFRAQRYRGRNVITWWRRDNFGDRVQSKFEMVDSRYRVIRRFGGGNGYIGDPHEFNLTPRGTAYVTAYRTAVVDMSRFGGPKRGFLLDYIAQEIDVRTGLVVWEWHPLGNLRLNETYLRIPKRNTRPFDWFHLNSVNDDSDGNILLSARHTQALYKINRKTGRVMWRIGGKRSSFRLGKGVRFAFQHDVQRQPDGTLTIFDNGAGGVHGRVNRFSSAKTLRVDRKRRVVKLVRAYRSPRNRMSNSQGNTQRQPNGNLFVGWGSVNSCTEFAPDGRILFDLSFSAKTVSYRCFKAPWVGAPLTPIAVRSKSTGENSLVWVSWNGDTRVRTWRVLAGDGKLAFAGSAPRDGFETAIPVEGKPARFRLVGLDAAGKVIGRSKVNRLGKLTR